MSRHTRSVIALACAVGLGACTTDTRSTTLWDSDHGLNGYLDYVYRCPLLADATFECLSVRGRLYLGWGETKMTVTPSPSPQLRSGIGVMQPLPGETTLSISTQGREDAVGPNLYANITIEQTEQQPKVATTGEVTSNKTIHRYLVKLNTGYNEISSPQLGELVLTFQPGRHETPLNHCTNHPEASGVYVDCGGP